LPFRGRAVIDIWCVRLWRVVCGVLRWVTCDGGSQLAERDLCSAWGTHQLTKALHNHPALALDFALRSLSPSLSLSLFRARALARERVDGLIARCCMP
jgi:hypothetical protein